MAVVRLVVTIDGLSQQFLGPYGGSWIDTPGINQLASRGCVFDHAFCESLDPQQSIRDLWMAGPSLFEQYAEAGYVTVLIHDDDAWISELSSADQNIEVDVPDEIQPGDSIADTRMAALVGAALEKLDEADSNAFIWVHSRGMLAGWDAPNDVIANILDEEDPVPPRYEYPPAQSIHKDDDPDVLLGIRQSYAAQIAVLDACLKALFDHPRLSDKDSEVFLIGLRGYPLGEHAHVGLQDAPLYGEALQVPVIVRSKTIARQRWDGITSLADLHRFLAPTSSSGLLLPNREQMIFRQGDEVTVRTRDWMLRQCGVTSELYAKPDDRFEFNDVADILGEVVDTLVRQTMVG
jgi:hypothetical protein